MVGGISDFFNAVTSSYNSFANMLPPFAATFLNLLMLVLIVVVYIIFVFKFYIFIARRDILQLNLKRYNRSDHPFLTKLVATFFYITEFIILLPLMVFIWFSVFAFFLLMLTEGQTTASILIISAIIVSAIRIAAYYNSDLAKEVAKVLPFTLLAVALLTPGALKLNTLFTRLTELPLFFENILVYLAFVIFLELILRFFEFLFRLLGVEESKPYSDEI